MADEAKDWSRISHFRNWVSEHGELDGDSTHDVGTIHGEDGDVIITVGGTLNMGDLTREWVSVKFETEDGVYYIHNDEYTPDAHFTDGKLVFKRYGRFAGEQNEYGNWRTTDRSGEIIIHPSGEIEITETPFERDFGE